MGGRGSHDKLNAKLVEDRKRPIARANHSPEGRQRQNDEGAHSRGANGNTKTATAEEKGARLEPLGEECQGNEQ